MLPSANDCRKLSLESQTYTYQACLDNLGRAVQDAAKKGNNYVEVAIETDITGKAFLCDKLRESGFYFDTDGCIFKISW